MKVKPNNYSVIANESSLPNMFGSKEGKKILEGDLSLISAIKLNFSLFAPHKFPALFRIQKGVSKINQAIRNNPQKPKEKIDDELLLDFEIYAKSLGALPLATRW